MYATHPNSPNSADLPFSEPARRLLEAAHGEADRLRHEYVGTEHLVLALARQADTAALLARLGVDPDGVSALIGGTVRRGEAAPMPPAARPYTSRTQHVLSFAAESARAFGHAHVGPEHLVVGLMRERYGIGAQTLARQGLTAEQATDHARQCGAH